MFKEIIAISKNYAICKIDSVINDDLQSIINDLSITTELKEDLDSIIFSNLPIKDKRIKVRKLRKKGLSSIFIKMFMKLFEYIQGV